MNEKTPESKQEWCVTTARRAFVNARAEQLDAAIVSESKPTSEWLERMVGLVDHLCWALDLMDMYEKRLLQFGDPKELVHSNTQIQRKSAARQDLEGAWQLLNENSECGPCRDGNIPLNGWHKYLTGTHPDDSGNVPCKTERQACKPTSEGAREWLLDRSVNHDPDYLRRTAELLEAYAASRLSAVEGQLARMTAHKDAAQDSMAKLQKHRDDWREYAYGKREKPDDFLDGNMVDRGETEIERLQQRAEAAESEVKSLQIELEVLYADRREFALDRKAREEAESENKTLREQLEEVKRMMIVDHNKKNMLQDQLCETEVELERAWNELDWKLIETAPKTGEHILGARLTGDGVGFGICGGKTQSLFCVVHWWSNPGEEGWYDSFGGISQPMYFTHWQPLREVDELAALKENFKKIRRAETAESEVQRLRERITELEQVLKGSRLRFFYIFNLATNAWRDIPNIEAICKRIVGYAEEAKDEIDALPTAPEGSK